MQLGLVIIPGFEKIFVIAALLKRQGISMYNLIIWGSVTYTDICEPHNILLMTDHFKSHGQTDKKKSKK